MNLHNKNIIITGASSGIGKCLLYDLIKEKANVSFCGRSTDKMNLIENDLKHRGVDNYLSETFCLTEHERIKSFISHAHERFGSIDIVVNCAGLNSARDAVEDIDLKDLEWMMSINFYAPLVVMQEAFKIMKENNTGLIVNILSTACLYSNEGIGAYTASKAALDSLTKVFRKEARDNNIRVASIYPGGVNTSFRKNENNNYLSPESVSEAIVAHLKLNDEIALDEIVLRPMIEKNYS